MSNLTTHLQDISESLGFKPSSVVVENGIAKINFAQRDGSSGRLGVSLRKPLLEAGVTSDAITATADQVCVHFSRGKANFVAGSPEWESYFEGEGQDALRDAELLKRKIKDKKADLTQTESNIEEGVALMKKSLANQNKAGYLRAKQILYNADRVRSSFSRTGAKAEFATPYIYSDDDEDKQEMGSYEIATAKRIMKDMMELKARCLKKKESLEKQIPIIRQVYQAYESSVRLNNYKLWRDAEYLSERLDRQISASFSRTAVDKESFTTTSFSRTGAKANNARPSLQEVMKSIDDYRASGASDAAVQQYSETVLRAWQAESGR